MPKKASGTKRRTSRAKTATRTVYRTAKRVGHRAKSGLMDGAKPLTMLLFGAAGYFLGDALQDSGIASLVAASPIGNKLYQAAQTGGSGVNFGVSLTKMGGVAALIHSLYESRHGTVKSGVLNAELPFAVGAILDDPSYGATTGLPGSGGPQGYWSG